jgi:hypothetical protein
MSAWDNVIIILWLSLICVLLFVMIKPIVVQMALEKAFSSSEYVAITTANLLTISKAAPETMKIVYRLPLAEENVIYSVTCKDRKVTVCRTSISPEQCTGTNTFQCQGSTSVECDATYCEFDSLSSTCSPKHCNSFSEDESQCTSAGCTWINPSTKQCSDAVTASDAEISYPSFYGIAFNKYNSGSQAVLDISPLGQGVAV